MTALRKIISGGQTGVDQAALRAARDCGLEIGGWCPPGRECEAGIIPEEFPLKETEQERSPDAPDVPRSQRTEWNVRDSDGTLVIRAGFRRDVLLRVPLVSTSVENKSDAPKRLPPRSGVDWTTQCAKRYQRPFLICDVSDPNVGTKIREWLVAHSIRTLNVAGPSESSAPRIGDDTYRLLTDVFEL